jgi:hypothetical protein
VLTQSTGDSYSCKKPSVHLRDLVARFDVHDAATPNAVATLIQAGVRLLVRRQKFHSCFFRVLSTTSDFHPHVITVVFDAKHTTQAKSYHGAQPVFRTERLRRPHRYVPTRGHLHTDHCKCTGTRRSSKLQSIMDVVEVMNTDTLCCHGGAHPALASVQLNDKIPIARGGKKCPGRQP